MKTKNIFIGAAVSVLVLILFLFLDSGADKPGDSDLPKKQFINLGTASITGVYYLEGGAICKIVSQKSINSNIDCAVQSTPGAFYNLGSLLNGDMDIAIVQSDLLYNAYNGINYFDKPEKDLRFLLGLHMEGFTAVVRSSSDIHNIDDIPGNIVNRNVPGSGVYNTLALLMDAKGWKDSDFKLLSQLKSSEQAQALCDGKIDVMLDVVGHPNGALMEASSMCGIRVLSVPPKTLQLIISKYPFYRPYTIKADTIDSDADVETFGIDAFLVTTSKLSNDIAYNIIKNVFESINLFKSTHSLLSHVDYKHLANNHGIAPIHSGAYMYLKDIGVLD